jgi:hypothetical protein
MKVCDNCKRQYADSLQYCLEDGTVLRPIRDEQATLKFEARSTQSNIHTDQRVAWGLFAIAGVALAAVICVVALVIFLKWPGPANDTNRAGDPPGQTTTASQPSTNPGLTNADAERELDQLNNDVAQALLNKDVAKLDQLLSDDYRYVGDRGISVSKPDMLTLFNTGNLSYQYLTTTDGKIEVTSDLTKGTITGHANSRGQLRHVPWTDSYFYRNSFEKRQGRWQLVSGTSWH